MRLGRQVIVMPGEAVQCWCDQCDGEVVSRRTWIRHGRRDERKEPMDDNRQVTMAEVVIRDAEDDMDDEGSDDSASSASVDFDQANPLGLIVDALGDDQELGAGELKMLFLDWVSGHRLTDSAAKDAWSMLRLVASEDKAADMGTWRQLKSMLEAFEEETVEKIDVCPNDCIAYWDSKHLPTPYRHWHRTKCPVCNTPRYVDDPKDGARRPRKVNTMFALN